MKGRDTVIFQLVGGDELERYLREVGDRLKTDADTEVEKLGSKTKNVIKKQLNVGHNQALQDSPHASTTGGGVLSGVFKKSIKYENMNKGKNKEFGKIHFKVGATAPHYRLAHLLEDGHVLWCYGTNTHKYTKSIPHMSVSQKFADDKVASTFKRAIKNSFEKG